MPAKLQDHHRQRPAYIYVRQSTIAQVRHHQESTERQYALKDKAIALGWSADNIRILDGDLGVSGAQASNRQDFKTLAADVSMGKVGAVLALEASRLARSCLDWQRLLELWPQQTRKPRCLPLPGTSRACGTLRRPKPRTRSECSGSSSKT